MIIDIITVVLLVLAVIKGFQRGLIVAIFSLLAIIIGLAAAIKLSAIVAAKLADQISVSDRWLPIISFAIVFIGMVLLIRLGANAIEKAVQAITLGWLNRLGGIVFYIIIYLTVFSVILFYLEKMSIIKPETISNSIFYRFIQPLGPWAIDGLGVVLPFFRDMFSELERFFEGVGSKVDKDKEVSMLLVNLR